MLTKLIQSLLIAALCTTTTYASQSTIKPYFQNLNGCFILYLDNKMIEHFNTERCKLRLPADSTFKIALSLMAFDQQLINQNTVFKWDGNQRMLPQWNHDQTPRSWLFNSAIWVSQYLTPQLGMIKVNDYLHRFQYGNCDFSGHPGKHDGLTQAWLNSSLKLSSDEQLHFLKELVHQTLPVSQQAMVATKNNMRLLDLNNNTVLFGKTGSGQTNHQHDGWFVGYVKQSKRTYIFVTNLSYNDEYSTKAGGAIAREITLKILRAQRIIS